MWLLFHKVHNILQNACETPLFISHLLHDPGITHFSQKLQKFLRTVLYPFIFVRPTILAFRRVSTGPKWRKFSGLSQVLCITKLRDAFIDFIIWRFNRIMTAMCSSRFGSWCSCDFLEWWHCFPWGKIHFSDLFFHAGGSIQILSNESNLHANVRISEQCFTWMQ